MEDKAEQVHGEIGRLYACLEKKHDIVCKVDFFFWQIWKQSKE